MKYNQITYNLVAKVLREEIDRNYRNSHGNFMLYALSLAAINFAQRFRRDNPLFNPEKFLDQCSPDKKKLPLSQLWGLS